MAKTYLYRHFSKSGVLLYVGVTATPGTRTTQHSVGSQWFDQVARIDVENFGSVADALQAEKVAIRNENPLCNVSYSTENRSALRRRSMENLSILRDLKARFAYSTYAPIQDKFGYSRKDMIGFFSGAKTILGTPLHDFYVAGSSS